MNGPTGTSKPGFFGVVIDPQSYVNMAYLLLAFPLGTAYFVFLVTGLSVGFGLAITIVGIPILLLVLGGSWVLCAVERGLATVLLKETITPSVSQPASEGLWPRLKAHLSDRVTWTGVFYLLLKFPVGIATFTIAVTMISVTLGLLFAPAYMWLSDPLTLWGWEFDPFPWSWILTLIGIPMVFISVHLMNGLAVLSGGLARVMLGK
jgi:hypothetical protein